MSLFRLPGLGVLFLAGAALSAAPVTLENADWQLVIEPEHGGRASRLWHKPSGHNFANLARTQENGGALELAPLNGHMTGSHQDEQNEATYTIIAQSPELVKLRWRNPYVCFDGLEEEKTIAFSPDGAAFTMRIRVTNRSNEARFISYRIQDPVNPGFDFGDGAVSFPGQSPATFYYRAGIPSELAFSDLQYNGYVLTNQVRDIGLQVSVGDKALQSIYGWHGDVGAPGMINTVELYFPLARLEPGEEWTTEVEYRFFRPSAPEQVAPSVAQAVKELKSNAYDGTPRYTGGLPYLATMRPLFGADVPQILPMHPISTDLGVALPQGVAGVLDTVRLFGTPGEKINLAFALEAPAGQGLQEAIQFSALTDGVNMIPAAAWQPRYVMHDGMHLVKSCELAAAAPPEIARLGNSLTDAPEFSPVKLAPGEAAWVKSALYLPETAVPGNYLGTVRIGAQSFAVELEVLPFRLDPNDGKFVGSFFRIYSQDAPKPEWAMTREEFTAALQVATDAWNRGIVLYMGTPEEQRWAIGQLYELGWRNASVVLLIDRLSAAEIAELEKRYGFKIYNWTVDEPGTYKLIQRGLDRFTQLKQAGKRNPTITADSGLCGILGEYFPELVLHYVTNGFAHAAKLARSRGAKGQETFFYSCPLGRNAAERQARERILRGYILWNTPVNGIFDWGEDVEVSTPADAGFGGFIGKQLVSTIRRDTTFEGFKDYLYLKKLETLIALSPDTPTAREAQRFLDGLRQFFGDDFYLAGRNVDQSFLDQIRREAATLAGRLMPPLNTVAP